MKSIDHGILLKKINYSETSLILSFYTLEKGYQTYLFQGGKKKKGNILQPLTIVEIDAYQRPDSDLGKISAISPEFIPESIPYDPFKSGIAFFIAEILEQLLRGSDQDEALYRLIEQEIHWLDASESITNYPIWFMLRVADQLGFGIQQLGEDGRIFDLEDGTISNQTPAGHAYEDDSSVMELNRLLTLNQMELLAANVHKTHRTRIIEMLVSYYRWHIEGFTHPKSLHVLQTILS